MASSTLSTSQALSRTQIMRAALVVLLGFFASGVLGLVRTAVYNAMFGASSELDAFYAAQRIPELLFTLVAGGALGSSFIPVFAKLRASGRTEESWQLASAVMTLSALAAGVLGILLALTAPLYMPLFYQNELYQELAVRMTQLMLATTVIFSVSGLMMGILNTYQNFLLPALALSMNNVGLILGALVIAPLLSTTSGFFAYPQLLPLSLAGLLPDATAVVIANAPHTINIYGLAFGALLGAVLHLAIQLPGLRRLDGRPRFLPNPRLEGVMSVLRLMLPRMLGLAVTQINFLVNTTFATAMIAGSLVALNNAWFLMFFALGIIAQSVGTAVFPSLSALASENDMDGFRERLVGAMRGILFLALPATAVLILLGQPIVQVLYRRGAFSEEAAAGTAWALAFFSIGLCGHALLEVLSRAFYALSDTRTPVLIGIGAMLANITLNVILIQFIGDPASLSRGAFGGLALANSVTTLIEAIILWILLRRRLQWLDVREVSSSTARMGIATILMAAIVSLLIPMTNALGNLVQLILIGVIGAGVYFGTAALLKLDEARAIPQMLLRRVRRT
jgi:putative peptidoglycan lipid II flippase